MASLQGRPWSRPDTLPSWRGDSSAVAEILANLLENAFRYSPAGAPIGLRVAEPGERLQLCLWDGGAPIPEAEREAIFGRGVRGTTGRQRPGTGLGLALARDLARQLGGELELLEAPAGFDPALPAEGNAFLLSLPSAPPPPAAPLPAAG